LAARLLTTSPKLHRVPEDDDGGEQVHAGDAIVLTFA
jgi:hypothetical protein